jgi:hypothetical protein
MEDMARNEVIKDVYVQTFEKGLEVRPSISRYHAPALLPRCV